MTTWRLLAITMPLTVAAIAVLGAVGLGLPLAAAVLLGAVLAPTDPVLASEVQLPGPDEGDAGPGEPIRFALTSEAGLNDGLAFPLTNLAIAMAVGGDWFADTLERIASLLFLLLLGGATVDGALDELTIGGAAVGVGVVLVVRPLAGWIGLLGSDETASSKMAIAFFGIRGMGTVYYLSHAVNEEFFPAARQVWAVAVFTILVSIVVHGVSAGPVLARLDRTFGPQRSASRQTDS